MARLVGRWDEDGLRDAAERLDAAGVVCLSWRFLDGDRVIVEVQPPDCGRQVHAMSQVFRSVGARLTADG